jgi:hypothetical protein
MDKKQLAEMIKELRRQKLEEIIGKPFPFKPEHRKGTHGEDPQSSNQYLHTMKEDEQLDETLGGTYHKRKRNVFFQKKIPSKRGWQKAGQQKMRGRYDEEAHVEFKGGKTDTGQASDVIDVSPKDKNSVNKEISVTKENKEK